MRNYPSVVALTPGPSPAARGVMSDAGFSLLELLVVVVIVGLAVAIVGLSVGNNKPQELRNDARDFANYTAQVEDEALLSRGPWGVQLYRETNAEQGSEHIAYRFLRLTDQGWQPDAPRDIPRVVHFSDNVTATLEVDGTEQLIEPLNPARDDKKKSDDISKGDNKKMRDDNSKTLMPTIWLAPGGEVTPFKLQLRFVGGEEGPLVRSDALGRIELEIKPDEN